MKSVADVGCDHRMLALSLVCISGTAQAHNAAGRFRFSKVIGVDLSSQALDNGYIASLKRVNDVLFKIGTENYNK